MIDLEKYGFLQNGVNTDEWIHSDGYIIYAGIGISEDNKMDVELLTLQEFLASEFEFRGTHDEMNMYLTTKFRAKKLTELLENE